MSDIEKLKKFYKKESREKTSSDSSKDIDKLSGEVLVHSIAGRLKLSQYYASQGLCWDCGDRTPSLENSYHLCSKCIQKTEYQ